ncbi:hypothetical protein GPECTOR_6g507 [Gonium pectorale]|uniref:Uncharacterized protein n=1 Tax=Gonium pectorale TaxID=33097 RepID=A0A150GW49_GONPE|nr:hypothetical protein GPECTOR_6g507 [Gonium pectorale]|eukprot:KXZ53590.1 hypothetical protein GPECTOR_6g507 [Gonium pectorale]
MVISGALAPDSGADGSAGGEAAAQPRRDLWLLEASCYDPDGSDATALSAGGGPTSRPPWQAQVWLPVMPEGDLGAAAKAAGAEDDGWAVGAAGVTQGEDGMEVWLLLLGGKQGASQPSVVRAVSPPGGCLSLRPSCSRLSFSYDNSSACWPGGSPLASVRVASANADAPLQPLRSGLTAGGVGFLVQAPDGVPLLFRPRNNSPSGSYSIELRVMYNGLNRKRRCATLPPTADCDVATANGSTPVTFSAFPLRASQLAPVSYVVVVNTSYYYGQFAAPLPSPLDSAAGGPSANAGAIGGLVTLLPGGAAGSVSYAVDLPSPVPPAPPPDGRISVNVTVSFRSALGYSPLHLPNNRRWVASFYRMPTATSIDSLPSLNITDAYSAAAKVFPRRITPGTYSIEVTDSLLPDIIIYEATRTIDAGPAASVTLDVAMASLTFRVYFSRLVVSPGAGFTVGATSLFVSLYTLDQGSMGSALGGGGGLLGGALSTVDAAWDSEMTDSGIATFSLIPGINYFAILAYPSMVLKGPIAVASPSLSGGGGGAAVKDVELTQTLLCGAGTTTIINLQRGRFPADGVGTIVYGPGTVCTWVIITGQPLMTLTINTTGMVPGDTLSVITDSGSTTRLPSQLDAGNVMSIRIATSK